MMVPLTRSSAAGGDLAAFTVAVVYVAAGSAPDASGHGVSISFRYKGLE